MALNLLRKTDKNKNRLSRLSVSIIAIACVAVTGLLVFTGVSLQDNSVLVYEADDNGALELRGTIFARADVSGSSSVSEIVFTVSIPEDGLPVNFTTPPNNVVEISCTGIDQPAEDMDWKFEEYVIGDGDAMLESGETFLITLETAGNVNLGPSDNFTIEVRTPDGEVLAVERTMPDNLDPVMNLR